MKEEKNVSCRLPVETHDKLTKRLKSLVQGRKVSVGDLIAATLKVPDEIIKPLVDEVLSEKIRFRSEAVGLGMKVRGLSSKSQAKIQAIIDAEEFNE